MSSQVTVGSDSSYCSLPVLIVMVGMTYFGLVGFDLVCFDLGYYLVLFESPGYVDYKITVLL